MFSFFKKGSKKKFLSLKSHIGSKIKALFSKKKEDPEFFEHIEKLLYESDLGVEIAQEITDDIREAIKNTPDVSVEEIFTLLEKKFLDILSPNIEEDHEEGESISKEIETGLDGKSSNRSSDFDPSAPSKEKIPYVILFIGVNGSGKTTNLIKLAYRYKKEGKNVLIGAGDTFRAAATEQLEAWARKLGISLVKGQKNSDPSAVVYDTLAAAVARNVDVVLIDTAGRLHTKTDLMHELKKIRGVCQKLIPGSPHETLLTLDASIGQNAVDQARIFHNFTPIDALFLSKMDGSAKGGIILQIKKELQIPVKYIGIGEKEEDMKEFFPYEFVEELLKEEEEE